MVRAGPGSFALVLAPFVMLVGCGNTDGAAFSVYERTKAASMTYAAYSWNWVRRPDGTAEQGWSVEFHSGRMHRVEAPHIRLIADCVSGIGIGFDVASGEIFRNARIAQAACGINSNRDLSTLQTIGTRNGRWGRADVVSVNDEDGESRYAVSQSGVIVASEIVPENEGGACIRGVAIALTDELPAGEMFSEQSLTRSFVPSQFTVMPEAIERAYWTADERCGT